MAYFTEVSSAPAIPDGQTTTVLALVFYELGSVFRTAPCGGHASPTDDVFAAPYGTRIQGHFVLDAAMPHPPEEWLCALRAVVVAVIVIAVEERIIVVFAVGILEYFRLILCGYAVDGEPLNFTLEVLQRFKNAA